MFELNIGSTPCNLTPEDLRELAEATEGYSGSDLSVRRDSAASALTLQVLVRDGETVRFAVELIRAAIMAPIRKFMEATHFKPVRDAPVKQLADTAQVQVPVPDSNPPRTERKLMPCSPGDAGAEERSWTVRLRIAHALAERGTGH